MTMNSRKGKCFDCLVDFDSAQSDKILRSDSIILQNMLVIKQKKEEFLNPSF